MDRFERGARIPAGRVVLEGSLVIPENLRGFVIFAHGSSSSRFSPRNAAVAATLNEAGFATLLFDLLTEEEDVEYCQRFEIGLLGDRLQLATDWLQGQPETGTSTMGYFGASTGAAAALLAAAARGPEIGAVVSRGGRPDLADEALPLVTAATLLIVGGNDEIVLDLNRRAYSAMTCPRRLQVIPGATHLFEEPGALEEVARAASDWFGQYLAPAAHAVAA